MLESSLEDLRDWIAAQFTRTTDQEFSQKAQIVGSEMFQIARMNGPQDLDRGARFEFTFVDDGLCELSLTEPVASTLEDKKIRVAALVDKRADFAGLTDDERAIASVVGLSDRLDIVSNDASTRLSVSLTDKPAEGSGGRLDMSISSTDLPRAATGPLRIAALALIIFGTGFVFWGMYAPITTTLSLTGRIVSSKPAFALQHPYGGRVANVLVQLHDQVSRDQPLMILDSALDGARRDAEVSLRARLARENAVITQILANNTSNAMAETPLGLRYRQSQLRVRMLGDRAEGQAAQQISLGEKLALPRHSLG